MPEVWRKDSDNFSILVWESNEPVEKLMSSACLNKNDLTDFYTFKSETRKREWVTVRTVIQKMMPGLVGSILYDTNGRPQLIGKKSISISHSGPYIAVMLADSGRIGIDIEEIAPRIEKLSRKFVSEKEEPFVNHTFRQEKLHVLWGAKEVLFKIHSQGGLDFKSDLLIEPFEYPGNGTCHASIKKKFFEMSFLVYYENLNGYMLTYARKQ